MDFLGIGWGEGALLLILALLIFGPEKLPQIARTVGRVSRQIRQVSTDFTREISREAEDIEAVRKELSQAVKESLPDIEAVRKEMSQAVKESLPDIEIPRLDIDLSKIEEESTPANTLQSKADVEKEH